MRRAINLNFKYSRGSPELARSRRIKLWRIWRWVDEAAPAEDMVEIGDASVKLSHGRERQATMQVLEGSREEIEK